MPAPAGDHIVVAIARPDAFVGVVHGARVQLARCTRWRQAAQKLPCDPAPGGSTLHGFRAAHLLTHHHRSIGCEPAHPATAYTASRIWSSLIAAKSVARTTLSLARSLPARRRVPCCIPLPPCAIGRNCGSPGCRRTRYGSRLIPAGATSQPLLTSPASTGTPHTPTRCYTGLRWTRPPRCRSCCRTGCFEPALSAGHQIAGTISATCPWGCASWLAGPVVVAVASVLAGLICR